MDPLTLTRSALGMGTTLLLLLLLDVVERGMPKDFREGNAARRLLRVGQVIGAFLVAASAVKNGATGAGLGHDAAWSFGGAVAGLVLFVATGKLGARLVLGARLTHELERGNVAAGLAAGAQYVAAGLVAAVAIGGDDPRSIGLSLAFFALAVVTLQLFIAGFRALTVYDDAEQIAGENVAAALSHAGLSLAVAVIVARAVEGDFVGWAISLKGYGGVLLSALTLYPVRQVFVQGALLRAPIKLRGGRIDAGIANDRDVGLAALEAATYLATALSISRLA
jgi:uncharacterized membrane protein YjfL (UPF0719 family)